MSTNEELVASGLRVLRDPLSLFVCRGIEEEFGGDWWAAGVLEALITTETPTVEDVRRYRHLPENGSVEECAASLDIAVCLILFTKQWFRIFGPLLGKNRRDDRGWAFELIGVRKVNKHLAANDHPSDFTWRALDTMYRLLEPIDSAAAVELVALRSAVDLSEYGHGATASRIVAAELPETRTSDSQPRTEHASSALASPDLDEETASMSADFSGADLRNMAFIGADLRGADFTNADLRGADFSRANLSGAVLKGSRLSDSLGDAAVFVGATLDGATLNFTGSDLQYANLSGLNLEGADFTNADLRNTNLSNADLSRAVFKGTRLGDSLSHGAVLAGAKLDGATLNFTGSDLQYANLSGLNLEGADFTNADLRNTNLSKAILRGVNLKGSRLGDANTAEVRWA